MISVDPSNPLPAKELEMGEFASRGRRQSEFALVDDLEALGTFKGDAIFLPERLTEAPSYLRDLGNGACIYKLKNALYIPGHMISSHSETSTEISSRLPLGIRRRGRWLLLTGEAEIFPESFTRGWQVPPAVGFGNDNWKFGLPAITECIDEPTLFMELISGHFGHALTDMPGRLWPFDLPDGSSFFQSLRLACMPVRYPMDLDMSSWTAWTPGILEALGTSDRRLLFLKKPTMFRELYVPSRIAPFLQPSGPRYNSLMMRIGDHFLAGRQEGAERKVYLSRSRLSSASRALGADVESMLDEMFSAKGFLVFHPQEHDPSTQIAVIRGAEIIAGPAGSQMHLAVFSKKPIRMLRFAPSYFHGQCDSEIVKSKGGAFSEFLVQRSEDPGTPIHLAPWELKSSELLALDRFVDSWLESTGPLFDLFQEEC